MAPPIIALVIGSGYVKRRATICRRRRAACITFAGRIFGRHTISHAKKKRGGPLKRGPPLIIVVLDCRQNRASALAESNAAMIFVLTETGHNDLVAIG